MKYDSEYYTVMANDIVRGKQDMTLQEAKILRLLITQVVKEDKDFKTFTCSIQDLASFLNIPPNNLYRDIKGICFNLTQRVVQIGIGNPKEPWTFFSWISSARYDGEGTVILRLSDEIKPYLIDLNKYFTQYQLENILEMKSFYGIRLYELLRSEHYKDENRYQEYSIEFLRQFFECEKKYKAFKDFRDRVLEIAIKEINEKSDIYVYEALMVKTGRKVTGIKFCVGFNHKVNLERNPNLNPRDKTKKINH